MNLQESIFAALSQEEPQERLINVCAAYAISVLHLIACAHVQHWGTSYAQRHVALGELYETLQEEIDGFVETAIGAGIFSKEDLYFAATKANTINYNGFDEQLGYVIMATTSEIEKMKPVSAWASSMDKLVDIQEAINKYLYLVSQN